MFFVNVNYVEIIGCRIKGICGILSDLPNYISLGHKNVNLSVGFFAFRGGADDDVSKVMNDLARMAAERDMVLEISEV